MKSVRSRNLAISVCLLAIFFCFPLSGFAAESDSKVSPTAAPEFTLRDLSGKEVSLKDFRGKTVVLDFWATWCPPCRKTIPELVALQTKYKDDGLIVLGVSLDDARRTSNDQLSAFGKEKNINYIILRADQKVVSDYFGSGSLSIPFLAFIDQNGMIVDRLEGYAAGVLEQKLSRIIQTPSAAGNPG